MHIMEGQITARFLVTLALFLRVDNPADEWGRQYNRNKIFQYKCNIHFQYFDVISGMQFY